MKRFLTFEEINYIKAALTFFDRHGPAEVVVANYSASYPNDPEKAIVKYDKSVIRTIKEVFGTMDETYLEMLRTFMGTQMSDLADHEGMIKALTDYKEELEDRIRNTWPVWTLETLEEKLSIPYKELVLPNLPSRAEDWGFDLDQSLSIMYIAAQLDDPPPVNVSGPRFDMAWAIVMNEVDTVMGISFHERMDLLLEALGEQYPDGLNNPDNLEYLYQEYVNFWETGGIS